MRKSQRINLARHLGVQPRDQRGEKANDGTPVHHHQGLSGTKAGIPALVLKEWTLRSNEISMMFFV